MKVIPYGVKVAVIKNFLHAGNGCLQESKIDGAKHELRRAEPNARKRSWCKMEVSGAYITATESASQPRLSSRLKFPFQNC